MFKDRVNTNFRITLISKDGREGRRAVYRAEDGKGTLFRFRVQRDARRKNFNCAWKEGMLTLLTPSSFSDQFLPMLMERYFYELSELEQKIRCEEEKTAKSKHKEPELAANPQNNPRNFKTILLNGKELSIIWERTKGSRVTFTMPTSDSLLIKLPRYASKEGTMRWLYENLDRLDRLQKAKESNEAVKNQFLERILNERRIVLLDVDRSIEITSKRRSEGVEDDVVRIYLPEESRTQEDVLAALRRCIKKWAHPLLEEEVEAKVSLMQPTRYPYSRFFLGTAKQRWGSCNSRGHIRIHWNAVFLPSEVRDYLIIHEVSHLKEMNHSERFWACVEAYCPNYRRIEKVLKSYKIGML